MPSDSTITVKIVFTWRCAACEAKNTTTSTEDTQPRELPVKDKWKEPSWYGDACEGCGEKAGGETGLLSVEVEAS
jgi:hypothetical protein